MKITKRQLRRLIQESVFAEYQQDVRGGDPGPNIAMINVRRMTQEYAYERPYMGMRRKDRLQRPSHGGEYYDFEIKINANGQVYRFNNPPGKQGLHASAIRGAQNNLDSGYNKLSDHPFFANIARKLGVPEEALSMIRVSPIGIIEKSDEMIANVAPDDREDYQLKSIDGESY